MRPFLIMAGAVTRRREPTGGGGGDVAVIQADKHDGYSGTGATVTLPAGVTTGNKVVIALRVNTGKTITPPSGFSLDGTATEVNSSGTEIRFYSRGSVTGAPTSFAFTWSDGDSGWSATIVEAANLGAFSSVVGQLGSFGNSAGGHSINVTTPAAGSLVVAHHDGGSEVTATGTSPAVAADGAAGYNHGFYGIYPSAGSNSIAWTYGSNSQSFHAAAVYAPVEA
jgi:hypothetical protein